MSFEHGNTQEIRINDNYTSLITADYQKTKQGDSTPISRKKTILTTTYIQKLMQNTGDSSSAMLPPNCRFMEKYVNGTIVMIEEPPAMRTIAVDMSQTKVLHRLRESKKLEEYGYDYEKEIEAPRPYMFTLAIPFSIFIITLNSGMEITSGQIYFRNKQLSGFGDYLLKTPFPNISDGGWICFGDRIHNKNNSLYSAVQNVQDVFWTSIFNTDYTYNVDAYTKVAGLCDYYTWQYMSATNPMFIYNAKWIKMPFKLGEKLQSTTQGQNLTRANQDPYNTFVNAFSVPTTTGKVVKPFKTARKKIPLYYDMAQGYFMTPSVCAHVGDMFLLKNKKEVHIDNFIGFMDADGPHIVRLNVEGKLITLKMTKPVKKFIAKQLEKYLTETKIEVDGKLIKKGQILVFKNLSGNEVYKKVKYIRKAVDGNMELHIGAEYYLADNIKDFEIFDQKTIKIYGQEIKSGDKFILLRDSQNMVPLHTAARVEFEKVTIDSSDRLSYKFTDLNKIIRDNVYNILSSNIQKSRLLKDDEVISVDGVFRLGRTLLQNIKEGSDLWKTPYGYLKDGISRIERANWTSIKTDLLKNEDELFIQSFDLDISFKIGDKVIVSDWTNPLNMLSIKMIQGFKVNDSNHNISLILIDKHGNLSEHVYIQESSIKTGTVRKVSNIHNKVKVGTKITAKTGRIPCFPKRDTNIIVAFITDTGIDEPLVLCSNCCTLWFSDMMEKFDRTTMRARKWNDMPHVDIDLSKIHYQPGDIVNGTSDYKSDKGYMVFKDDTKYGST